MVSGRARDTLDAWFGALPIGLWAEHGALFRAAPAVEWESVLTVPCCDWIPEVRAMMEEFSATTPGAFVEEKHASIAWHYRQAARGFGRVQARELRLVLSKAMIDGPIEIIEGKRVLEVRSRGASKADDRPAAPLAGHIRRRRSWLSAMTGPMRTCCSVAAFSGCGACGFGRESCPASPARSDGHTQLLEGAASLRGRRLPVSRTPIAA